MYAFVSMYVASMIMLGHVCCVHTHVMCDDILYAAPNPISNYTINISSTNNDTVRITWKVCMHINEPYLCG